MERFLFDFEKVVVLNKGYLWIVDILFVLFFKLIKFWVEFLFFKLVI